MGRKSCQIFEESLKHEKIWKKIKDDPYKQTANLRDGAFAILTGVAARKSCDSGKPIKLADLTDLKPQSKKS